MSTAKHKIFANDKNPFYFQFSDPAVMDKKKAPNYMPPNKRLEIKNYFT